MGGASQQALQAYHAGDFQQAQQLYLQILRHDPEHVEALQMLGLLMLQTGRLQLAVQYLTRALSLRPDLEEAQCNLGIVLAKQGMIPAAITCYQKALLLRSDFPIAHLSLGNALIAQGKVDEAIDSYRRSIEIRPDFADGHNNLGNAWSHKGNVAEAIVSYRRAIEIKGDFAAPHKNLGNALMAQGQVDEAIVYYRRAIELQPDFADAYSCLATALKGQGKLEEALACFDRALHLKPDYAEAHNNLGNALKEAGKRAEALASYRRAIELKPDCADAYNNLGIALHEQDQLDEAVATFRLALHHKPQFAAAYSNLGNVLGHRGECREAAQWYRRALELNPDFVHAHSNLVCTLHFLPEWDANAIAEAHRRWYQQHAEPLARSIRPHTNDRSRRRRLRVGYVSPDFGEHVVGRNVWPLIRDHDHTDFEIYLYSNRRGADPLTQRFRQCADNWRSIAGWGDEQVADQIRRDGVDILVDLALHMAGGRLLVFARKPAPVQVSFAGYPSSTGVPTIDYRLTDPYLDPPGADWPGDAEQPYRLPDTFWCYDPLTEEPGVAPLPAEKTGAITFGCLNNLAKINDVVLDLWAGVLRGVINSRVRLSAPEGDSRQRIIDFMADRGIAAARVQFSARKQRQEYLELYHDIDVGLDTFPYNGHTTSLDSYWMGVPVVTLVGSAPVGRAGLSQLTNLGLEELAARTPEEFVRIALQLAGDRSRLSSLRVGLRERMRQSPLMDAPRFARAIETAYRTMWQRWCATTSQSVDVSG
jgi:predicted O-linked N-acetylglucosamine transferase (SPINDLY family)